MCVLAFEENKKDFYYPFQSYGFCESVQIDNAQHLVGTSYLNYSSPFIRYDLEDIIEPFINDGILENFKISSGRVGEFIFDKNGKRISLTSLIFGRHHKLFSYIDFLQVQQSENGIVTLIISTVKNYETEFILKNLDLSNVDIQFIIKITKVPIKTINGKISLLVS